MKVQLLVTLKTASGAIVPGGTLFTDEKGPIPDFVMRRVNRGQATVLDPTPTKVSDAEESTKTAELPKAVQKLLKKGGKNGKKEDKDEEE